MRKKKEPQLNLLNLMPRNKIARELEAISRLLDANQDILELVYGDLVKYRRQDTGRNGMTAKQVLRCAILKQYRELTYEELVFIWMTPGPSGLLPGWRWGNIPAAPPCRITSAPSPPRPGKR
jgi:hypothetical protein